MVLQNTQIDFSVVDETENKFNTTAVLAEDDKVIVVKEGHTEVFEEAVEGSETIDYNPNTVGALKEISRITFDGDFNLGLLHFNNDGTKVFSLDKTTGIIRDINLNAPYIIGDNTTYTVQGLYNYADLLNGADCPVGTADSKINHIDFDNTGNKLFINTAGAEIYLLEFSLSSPWNLTNSIYNVKSHGSYSSAKNFKFHPSGTKLLEWSYIAERIYEYELTIPFDLSTRIYNYINSTSMSYTPKGTALDIIEIEFSKDGNSLFILDAVNEIFSYKLNTPFDHKTTSSNSTNIDSQLTLSADFPDAQIVSIVTHPKGLILTSNDGTIISYIFSSESLLIEPNYDNVSYLGSPNINEFNKILMSKDGSKIYSFDTDKKLITQFNLNINYDPTSISSYKIKFIEVPNNYFTGMTLINNDTQLLIYGYSTYAALKVYKYTIGLNFDLILEEDFSISYNILTDASHIKYNIDLIFSLDGTKLVTFNNNELTYTRLEIPWDLNSLIDTDGQQKLISGIDIQSGDYSNAMSNDDLSVIVIFNKHNSNFITLKLPENSELLNAGDYIQEGNELFITNQNITLDSLGEFTFIDNGNAILYGNNESQSFIKINLNENYQLNTLNFDSIQGIGETAHADGENAMQFNSDGTKLITYSSYGYLNTYILNTPYKVDDILDKQYIDINDLGNSLELNNLKSDDGIFRFSDDGLLFYYTKGNTSYPEFYKITLSTAWDLNTCISGESFINSEIEHIGDKNKIEFLANGTKLLLVQYNRTYIYDLTTPFEINTAVNNNNFITTSNKVRPGHTSFFNGVGTIMYALNYVNHSVDAQEYNLSENGTVYNLSDYIRSTINNLDLYPFFDKIVDDTIDRTSDHYSAIFEFVDNGNKFLQGLKTRDIVISELETPYQFTNMTNKQSILIGPNSSNPYDFFFSDDGMKVILWDNNIHCYELSVKHDINSWTKHTAIWRNELDYYHESYTNLTINHIDPTKLTLFDTSNKTIYEITLNTAWNLSEYSFTDRTSEFTYSSSYSFTIGSHTGKFAQDGSIYYMGYASKLYIRELNIPYDLTSMISDVYYSTNTILSHNAYPPPTYQFNNDGSILYLYAANIIDKINITDLSLVKYTLNDSAEPFNPNNYTKEKFTCVPSLDSNYKSTAYPRMKFFDNFNCFGYFEHNRETLSVVELSDQERFSVLGSTHIETEDLHNDIYDINCYYNTFYYSDDGLTYFVHTNEGYIRKLQLQTPHRLDSIIDYGSGSGDLWLKLSDLGISSNYYHMEFSPDLSKLFLLSNDNYFKLYQIDLSIPGDLTTCTLNNNYIDGLSFNSLTSSSAMYAGYIVKSFKFIDNGSKIAFINTNEQYTVINLPSAYTLPTLVEGSITEVEYNYTIVSYNTYLTKPNIYNMNFIDNGSVMYFWEDNDLFRVELSTPYDVSTVTNITTLTAFSTKYDPYDFKIDTTNNIIRTFVDSKIIEYKFDQLIDLNTSVVLEIVETHSTENTIAGILHQLRFIEYNETGTKAFINSDTDGTIMVYPLTNPYDITEFEFNPLDIKYTLFTFPEWTGGIINTISFRQEGTLAFISSDGYFKKYYLSTPYDFETASTIEPIAILPSTDYSSSQAIIDASLGIDSSSYFSSMDTSEKFMITQTGTVDAIINSTTCSNLLLRMDDTKEQSTIIWTQKDIKIIFGDDSYTLGEYYSNLNLNGSPISDINSTHLDINGDYRLVLSIPAGWNTITTPINQNTNTLNGVYLINVDQNTFQVADNYNYTNGLTISDCGNFIQESGSIPYDRTGVLKLLEPFCLGYYDEIGVGTDFNYPIGSFPTRRLRFLDTGLIIDAEKDYFAIYPNLNNAENPNDFVDGIQNKDVNHATFEILQHSFSNILGNVYISGNHAYLMGDNFKIIKQDLTKTNDSNYLPISKNQAISDQYNVIGNTNNNSEDFIYNGDGTKIYFTKDLNSKITEFSLSIPYDITTLENFNKSSELPKKYSKLIEWNIDGTGIILYNEGILYQFSVSVPYDITTVESNEDNYTSTYNIGLIQSACFNSDGTKLTTIDTTGYLDMYSMSIPKDISTLSFIETFKMNGSDIETPLPTIADINGVAWNGDGTELMIADGYKLKILRLKEPYNLYSIDAKYDKYMKMDMRENKIAIIKFNLDGTKVYFIDDTYHCYLHKYPLDEAYNLGGLEMYNYNNMAMDTSNINSIIFNENGSKLYIYDKDNYEIHVYDLVEYYNINDMRQDYASKIDINSLISNGFNNDIEMTWNLDGTKLIINDYNNNFGEVNIGIPYDLNSANDWNIFPVSLNEIINETTISVKGTFSNSGLYFVYGKYTESILKVVKLTTPFDLNSGILHSEIETNLIGILGAAFNSTDKQLIIPRYNTNEIINILFDETDDISSNNIQNITSIEVPYKIEASIILSNPNIEGKFQTLYSRNSNSTLSMYNLITPDVVSIFNGSVEFDLNAISITNAESMIYTYNGTKLLISALIPNAAVIEYDLEIPYNPTSLIYSPNIKYISNDELNLPRHMQFNDDGTKFAYCNENGTFIHNLLNPYVLTDVNFDNPTSILNTDSTNYYFNITPDGLRLQTINNNMFKEYISETPWNFSNVVSTNESPADYNYQDLIFDNSGLKIVCQNDYNSLEFETSIPFRFFDDQGNCIIKYTNKLHKTTYTKSMLLNENNSSIYYLYNIGDLKGSNIYEYTISDFELKSSSYILYYPGSEQTGTIQLIENDYKVIDNESNNINSIDADKMYVIDQYSHDTQYRPEYAQKFCALQPVLTTQLEEIEFSAIQGFDISIISNIPDKDIKVVGITIGNDVVLETNATLIKYGTNYRLLDNNGSFIPINFTHMYYSVNNELKVPYRFYNDDEEYSNGLIPLQETLLPIELETLEYSIDENMDLFKIETYVLQESPAQCFAFMLSNNNTNTSNITNITFNNKVLPKSEETFDVNSIVLDDTFIETEPNI